MRSFPDGSQAWYLNGRLHREDGPAVINSNYQAWYFRGQLHRADGPAYIQFDGFQSWFLRGVQVSAWEVFNKMTKEQKIKAAFNLDEWK